MTDNYPMFAPEERGIAVLQDRLQDVFETLAAIVEPAMEEAGLATEDFQVGLQQLSVGAIELAAQAHRAVTSGIPFAEAVHNYDGFPLLCKVYHSTLDLLDLSLPPDLQRFVRSFIKRTPSDFPPDFYHYVAVSAARFQGDLLGSLADFFLFVGVRVKLSVIQKVDPHEATRSGVTDELDREAERAVRLFMSQPDLLEETIEPLQSMVALACDRLLPVIDDLAGLYGQLDAESQKPYDLRAKLEAELADVDVGDALLIRKYASDRLPNLGIFGDNRPRMTNKSLRGMHPVVFGGKSDDAMNMQMDRVKKKFDSNGLKSLKRKVPTILDLLRERNEEGDQ
jgi:hypothetical protein